MAEKIIWIPDRREGKNEMEHSGVCPSHDRIDDSVKRQESILNQIRGENQAHQLQITKVLSEITEQLKAVHEIKGTLHEHNRRRDDDKGTCEERRADMWNEINKVKTRQDKKDGSLIIIGTICTSVGAAATWLITWLQKQ